jgi:hypothetical protein
MYAAGARVAQAKLSGRAKRFYEREFGFFSQITAISGNIRDKPLGPERKVRCQFRGNGRWRDENRPPSPPPFVHVCVCACVHVCVCACARVCMCACACARVGSSLCKGCVLGRAEQDQAAPGLLLASHSRRDGDCHRLPIRPPNAGKMAALATVRHPTRT